MMHLRSLLLVLLCAVASACATTGKSQADAAPTPATTVVSAGDAAASPADATAAIAPAPAPAQTVATTTAQDASGGDAEADFDAIYGQPAKGDDASATGASTAAVYDPWEKYNRRVHAFNSKVDNAIAKPLAQAYVRTVPRQVRTGIDNFFDNLGQPVTLVNSLLQGNPRGAANALGRFLLNSTVGVGGLFDVATKAKMPERGEDFGQTMAVWGWRRSRYLEVPFLGPRTVRDMFGLAVDTPLRPIQYVEDDKTRLFLQGLQAVDLRATLLQIEGFGEGAVDEYTLFRDIWLQRRNYQINQAGRRQQEKTQGNDLPPYLLEPGQESDVVPVAEPAATGQ